MISLSQILPRAQRHTSFTVTSGLAVATETRGGEYGEGGGIRAECVYVWCGGEGGCRLGDGVGGVGLAPTLPPPPSATTSLHQQPSLMRRELITELDWIWGKVLQCVLFHRAAECNLWPVAWEKKTYKKKKPKRKLSPYLQILLKSKRTYCQNY